MWLSEVAAQPRSGEQPRIVTACALTQTSPRTFSVAAVAALKNAPRLITRSWRTVTLPELASVHDPAMVSERYTPAFTVPLWHVTLPWWAEDHTSPVM